MTDHYEPGARSPLPDSSSTGPIGHTTEPVGAEQIGPLLRLAGPREPVPADRMRRVKAAVHAEWRQQSRARSRRVIAGWSAGAFAAAALLLFGVRLAVRDDTVAPGPAQTVATIEAVSGAAGVTFASGGAAPTLLQPGLGIREGDGVDTTRGGRAALRLAGGVSLRVDRGTRLQLTSGSAITLEEGSIYIDSGKNLADNALEIRTAVGVVRDVGTRFEVRFKGSDLRVRVRDGLVRLSQSRQSHEAKPGEELTLDGNGRIERRVVPVHGADWAWAAALAPPFDLEGRSLRDFVDWIAGENGWQVHFADAAVERKSRTTTLHGSIKDLTPEEALSAVLPASGVDHRLENGVLWILPGAGGAKD